MKMKIVVAVSVMALICGCAVPKKKIAIMTSFDSEQAKAMLEPGSSSIKGSALLRQKGGGVVTCAGNKVGLLPATDYTKERMTALFGAQDGGVITRWQFQKIELENPPDDFKTIKKESLCDAQGYFKFNNLKPGSYYVATSVTWIVRSEEGGLLSKLVTIGDGEEKEVVITAQ